MNNIPLNHHYVSQCQIKNFFNKEKGFIYLYDKILKNHFKKSTTKAVFSEKEGNSRFYNGEIDHSSLEKDLKDNFEDLYNFCLSCVIKLIQNPENPPSIFRKALLYLVRYGIAGEIRRPQEKFDSDSSIKKVLFEEFMPNAAPELKESLMKLKERTANSKYINSLFYSEFANTVLKAMGELSFVIYFIQGNNYFILPDRPSISKRMKINEYFNPDIKEIAMVGIPLSSKIFLHAESQKIRKLPDQIIYINEENHSILNKINIALYKYADKQVACENESYLKDFIEKIRS